MWLKKKKRQGAANCLNRNRCTWSEYQCAWDGRDTQEAHGKLQWGFGWLPFQFQPSNGFFFKLKTEILMNERPNGCKAATRLMGQVDIKYSIQYPRAFKNSSPRPFYCQRCVPSREGQETGSMHLRREKELPSSSHQASVRFEMETSPRTGLTSDSDPLWGSLACFWGSRVTGDSMMVCLSNKENNSITLVMEDKR